MADSTNPYDIPKGQFPLVAGYVDGAYAWSDAGWQYHDASLHVRIACSAATVDADVLDVEAGCATASDAGVWLAYHVVRNQWRVLYFSLGLFGEVHAAVLAAGVQDDQWGIWQANWDGVAVVPAGSLAKQYADSAMVGAHYDLSAVADYWPGVDALPAQAAASGAAAPVDAWNTFGAKLTQELPGFDSELGVLASGLQGLG